jgi:hypothetical protein
MHWAPSRGYLGPGTKFQIDQKRSLANELVALIATYRMGGDKGVLRIALDLIDSADWLRAASASRGSERRVVN